VGAPRPREFASKCHRRSAGVYQVALTLCSITGLCSRTGRGAVQPLPQHLWQLQSAPLSAACLRAAAVPGDTTSSTRVELRAHNAAKRRRRRGARTTNLWIADSLLCVIFPPLWAIRGIFLGAELLPAACFGCFAWLASKRRLRSRAARANSSSDTPSTAAALGPAAAAAAALPLHWPRFGIAGAYEDDAACGWAARLSPPPPPPPALLLPPLLLLPLPLPLLLLLLCRRRFFRCFFFCFFLFSFSFLFLFFFSFFSFFCFFSFLFLRHS
jgi:hypothetical protein